MSVETVERDKYTEVWGGISTYGNHAPGEQWAPAFVEMTRDTMRRSVLDAGCGSGKGALALKALGFPVTLCDLTGDGLVEEAQSLPFHQICLWGNIKRQVGFHDWVYCTDVMEHLPTEMVMLVVSRLLEVARRGVFFSITFVPDHFGSFIGTPLHQTVQPFVWWKSRLQELGELAEARDLLESGLFLVRPRC